VTAIGLAGAAPGWMDGLTASEAIQHSIHHP
jgi:F0F1-type ATP synthase membrane subunit c/vacuolar-type H+-ATPase subunit K